MANDKVITKQNVIEIKKRARSGEVRAALKILEQKRGGYLTPQDVLEEARSTLSPLHGSFDWDDNSAAEKYRLMQARVILLTVRVEYDGERQSGYLNAKVTINDRPVQGYFPVERVMTDAEIHQAVLDGVVQDLEYLQRKYERLKEFSGVINKEKLQALKQRRMR
jgi:hypothetical protein